MKRIPVSSSGDWITSDWKDVDGIFEQLDNELKNYGLEVVVGIEEPSDDNYYKIVKRGEEDNESGREIVRRMANTLLSGNSIALTTYNGKTGEMCEAILESPKEELWFKLTVKLYRGKIQRV